MKQMVRDFAISLVRRFGTLLIDQQTGKPLGRVLLLPWKGKVHVIGLIPAVRPVFVPQKRLTYWKQELGFTAHPPPDFPGIRRTTGMGHATSADE
jgi:hypothetical protein